MQLSYLSAGGLITNYYCRSKCRHCLYRCKPTAPHDYLSKQTTGQIVETLTALGCTSVHLGGGESLLDEKKLLAVLAALRENGMQVEYLETSSSWFSEHDAAVETLFRLRANGVHSLLVSVSPFHNEFIPYGKVQGVMRACRESGMEIFPWIRGFETDITQFDTERVHSLAEYIEQYGDVYPEQIFRRYWMHAGGRALGFMRKYIQAFPLEIILRGNPDGCNELTNVEHFHVDPYGHYIPGLCAGLAIDFKDLGAPLDPENYPIITTLYENGVNGLYDMASELGFKPSRQLYAHKCDVCDDIRTFLAQQTDSPELRPRFYYQER